jgi:hypothetical protein
MYVQNASAGSKYRVRWTDQFGRQHTKVFPATPAGLDRALRMKVKLPLGVNAKVDLVTPVPVVG